MTGDPVTLTRRIARTVEATGWSVRVGVSVLMAGFLALMGAVSFPLPWTPVPFSMMPFALLVSGAAQRPGYAAASVALYLVAAGLGAPVFADRAHGWHYLWGATAGYLWGFFLVSVLVSAYLRRPRTLMPRAWLWTVTSLAGASVLAAIGAIAWMAGKGVGFSGLDADLSSWGVARSSLWALLAVTAVSTVGSMVLLQRRRAEGHAALQLFLVMFAGLVALHFCGVTVLWLASPLSLMGAVVLGSIVFLPFDIVKAGLAVGLTLPFLPPETKEDPHA